MASRSANETQVSGSEDLKELCSALEGEIAQAGEAGDMVPIPKLTLVPREKTKSINYKTPRLKDVKQNSESQVPTRFKSKTDIDDGGWNYSSSCFSKLKNGADPAVTTDFGLENCQASQAFSAQAGVFQWQWQLCRICSILFMFKSFNLFLNSMF